jgi:hypothetical protein
VAVAATSLLAVAKSSLAPGHDCLFFLPFQTSLEAEPDWLQSQTFLQALEVQRRVEALELQRQVEALEVQALGVQALEHLEIPQRAYEAYHFVEDMLDKVR